MLKSKHIPGVSSHRPIPVPVPSNCSFKHVPSLQTPKALARHLPSATGMDLHIGETTITMPFNKVAGEQLHEAFGGLMKTFSEKQKATRPKRWDMLEFIYKGGSSDDEIESFEVFCNPNAHPTVLEAKVLITIKTKNSLKIITEARFSNIKSDLETYLGK